MFPIKTTSFHNHFHSLLKDPEEYSSDTLKLLAHLVEETADILTATDLDYRPITWNKACEKTYGLTSEQVIGKDLSAFLKIYYHDSNKENIRKIISAEGEWRGEAFFIRPTDHKKITLLMCYKELRKDGSDLLGYLISATDITERKESESRLKESEQRFREIAESSPAMIWLCDENNLTTYANRKWLEFTGKDIAANPEGWSSLIHPTDRAKATETYFQAVEQKRQITIVYRLLRFDGVYRWVHDVSVPRFLDNGRFIGYAGSIIDIQDEKQKHDQLLYHSTILENVSDIVVTTDLEYNIKSWNQIAEQLYGIPAEEAIGRRPGNLLNFTFYGTSKEDSMLELHNKGFWKGELSIVNRKGETKHFFHTVKFIFNEEGNKIGYLVIGRDITEKKIADEKLKESELFYRTLIADSLDGMLLMDKTGTITFASPTVKNILGYSSEDILGRNGFEFIHPEDIAWAFTSFQKEVEENPEIKFITVRILKKDARWIWCNVRGHNLLSNPYINSIVVYLHDDTLRKEAKDALQESEKKFRSLVRDLQIGAFLSDANGDFIMCNAALSNMISVPEEMIVGKNIYDIITGDVINEKNEFLPINERPVGRSIQLKQTVKDVVIGIVHPITKERTWIMINSNPILDEQGNIKHLVCSVMDVTERKKLEQKLIDDEISLQRQLTQATIDGQENERRTIGEELHDNIGQQLTTVKLFLDHAKTMADANTSEVLSLALKSVRDVINDVRSMSRSLVPFTLKDLGLVESIHELADSLMRARTIAIEFEHNGFNEEIIPENQKLSLFRIVQEQLNNIIKHSNAERVWIFLYNKKDEFVLEIRDNGKGFNTDSTRKGVGILNIKNRAELFNGHAKFFSNPGNGCKLMISFPLDANNLRNG